MTRGLRLGAAIAWFAALAGFAWWTRRPLVNEGLWTDEAISVYVASAPSTAEFLFRNRTSDYTPPLFNVVLAGYGRVAGFGETAVKNLALVFGFLAAAAGIALAAELGGLLAAGIAAAFLVNNPILIEMSAELRAYSLSAFLAGTTLVAVFRLRRRPVPPAPAAWILPTLALVLLVWSHVAGGMLAALLFLWGIDEARRFPERPFGRRLALSSLLAGGTFLAWLPTTWRQTRIGLPWERRLSPAEFLHSFEARTREMLPIAQGFEHPVFVVGLALLLGAAVLAGRRAAAAIGTDSRPLAFTALAAAVIWLVLGVYTGQSSRYLIVPATLLAAAFAAVLARFACAAWAAPRRIGIAAAAGVACLVAAAFVARRDFYEDRFAVARRPKSGLRTLCRARPFDAGEFLVIVPDYLAPTAWYYCGEEDRLRGYTHWRRPFLFDPARYRELWGDPAAAASAVARIEADLGPAPGAAFVLVREDDAAGLLPLYQDRVQALDAALASRFDARPLGRFPGRIESVRAAALKRR